MKKAAVSDGEIEYDVQGQGEPILFIHGVGLADAFMPVMSQPALAGFRRINIHRRGYMGSTPAPDPFSMTDQASDALAVLDALGLRRAHVAGHSYGGAITLQLAAHASERVQSLSLIDSAPPPGLFPPPPADAAPPPNPLEEATARAVARVAADDLPGAVETFFSFVFGSDWQEYFDAVPGGLQQTIADARTIYEVEGPAMGIWQSGSFDIGAIKQPVLVMWGTNSHLAAPTANRFVTAFPSAEGCAIADTDHALITQKPRDVAEALADFLKRHPI